MYICKYHLKILNCLIKNFHCVTNTFPRFFLTKSEFELLYNAVQQLDLRKSEFSLKFDIVHAIWPT